MNEPDFCSLLDYTIPYNLPVWKVIWLRSYQYRTPLLFGLKNKSNIYISWIKVVILIFNAKILNKESFSEIGNTANSDLGGQQDRGSLIGRGGYLRYQEKMMILSLCYLFTYPVRRWFPNFSWTEILSASSPHKFRKTLKWYLSCIAPSISKSLMIRSLFH